MKKLFLSLIVAGMLMTACKQNSTNGTAANTAAATAADAAVMTFEKTTHDFGKIKGGD